MDDEGLVEDNAGWKPGDDEEEVPDDDKRGEGAEGRDDLRVENMQRLSAEDR